MTGRSLLDAARARVVLADGAMGTELQRAGLEPGACGELWNVDHPDRVAAIHRAYLDAGAEVLLTNTFGGTRIALERHGAADRVTDVNRAAAELAVAARLAAAAGEAASASPPRGGGGEGPWVLGDVGPFGGLLAPLGEHDPGAVVEAFLEQAEALVAGGVDGILVETMMALDELALAVRAAKAAGAPIVIASVAFDATKVGYRTMMGATPADAARAALDAGGDALGANCGTGLGMEDYAGIVRAYREAAGDVVVLARANAGTPRLEGGAVVYDATPASMAEGVPGLVAAGAGIIGGCCGTTPAYIEAFARALA